jgi:hypothetical protein
VSDRDSVSLFVHQKLPNGEHIVAVNDTEHSSAPPSKGVVRCSGMRLLRFTEVSPKVTRYTVVSKLDLEGSIPRFISDKITIPQAAHTPLDAVGYFLHIKEPAMVRRAATP